MKAVLFVLLAMPLLQRQPLLLNAQHLCLELPLHRLMKPELGTHLPNTSLLRHIASTNPLIEKLHLPS